MESAVKGSQDLLLLLELVFSFPFFSLYFEMPLCNGASLSTALGLTGRSSWSLDYKKQTKPVGSKGEIKSLHKTDEAISMVLLMRQREFGGSM